MAVRDACVSSKRVQFSGSTSRGGAMVLTLKHVTHATEEDVCLGSNTVQKMLLIISHTHADSFAMYNCTIRVYEYGEVDERDPFFYFHPSNACSCQGAQ